MNLDVLDTEGLRLDDISEAVVLLDLHTWPHPRRQDDLGVVVLDSLVTPQTFPHCMYL